MARKRSGAGGQDAGGPAGGAQGPPDVHSPRDVRGDDPVLPRGRHGLSPVGRVKAADLAARKTAFAGALLDRARPVVPAATPSDFARGVQGRLLVPATPRVGGRAADLAGAIMDRYDAAEPLGARGTGDVTGHPDFQTLAARLDLLDQNSRTRRRPADDQELETEDERDGRPAGAAAFDGAGDLAGPTRTYAPGEEDAGRVDRALGGMLVPREPIETAVASSGTTVQGADLERSLVRAQPLGGQGRRELSERLGERGDWRPTFLTDRQLPVAVSLPPSGAAAEYDEEQEGEEADDETSSPSATRINEAAAMAPFTGLRELSGLVDSIQRKAVPGVDAPAEQQRTLALGQAMGSVGEPLEPATRRTMETALGADFAGVRVHTDGAAAGAATSLGAHAFTLGSSIYFAENAYQPAAPAGLALLGHELTHTLQQQGAPQRRAVAGHDGAGLNDDEPPHLEEQARSVEAMLHTLFSNALPDGRPEVGPPLGPASPAATVGITPRSNALSDTRSVMTMTAPPFAPWDRVPPSDGLESPRDLPGLAQTPADRASGSNAAMSPADVGGQPDRDGRAVTSADMRVLTNPTDMLVSGVGEPGGVTGRAPRDLDGGQDRSEDDAEPGLPPRGVGSLVGRGANLGAGDGPGGEPPSLRPAGTPTASEAPVPTLFDSASPAPAAPLDAGEETDEADASGGDAPSAWASPPPSGAAPPGDLVADGMGLPADDLTVSSLGSGADAVASMPPPRAVLPFSTLDASGGLARGGDDDDRAGVARGAVSPARDPSLIAGEDDGTVASVSGPGPSGVAPADLLTIGVTPTSDVPTLSSRGVAMPMHERSLTPSNGGGLVPTPEGGGTSGVGALAPASITPGVTGGFVGDAGNVATVGGDAAALSEGIAASYVGPERSWQAHDDGDATAPRTGLGGVGTGTLASGLPSDTFASGLAVGNLAGLAPVLPPGVVAAGARPPSGGAELGGPMGVMELPSVGLAPVTAHDGPAAASMLTSGIAFPADQPDEPSGVDGDGPSVGPYAMTLSGGARTDNGISEGAVPTRTRSLSGSSGAGDRPATDEDDGGDEAAPFGAGVESGSGAAGGSVARSGGLNITAMAPETLLTAGLGAFDDLIARGDNGRDGVPPAGQSALGTLATGGPFASDLSTIDAWNLDGLSGESAAAAGGARGRGALAGARPPSGGAEIGGPMRVMGLPSVGLAPLTAHDGPAPASMLTSGIAFPAGQPDEPDWVDGDGGPSVGPYAALSSGGARTDNGTAEAAERARTRGLGSNVSLAALLSSRAGTDTSNNGDNGDNRLPGHDDGAPAQEWSMPHTGASVTQRVTPAFGGMAPGQEHPPEAPSAPSQGGVPDNIEQALARLDTALGLGTDTERASGGGARRAPDDESASDEPEEDALGQAAPSVDELVNQVLARLKRQLMLDHDRAGGFLSHLMR